MTGSGLKAGPSVNARHGQIRRQIRDDEVDLPALLLGEGDDALEAEMLGIGIGSLVRAVPGIGAARVAGVLDGVYTGARMGMLTTRTRRRLADTIRREVQP